MLHPYAFHQPHTGHGCLVPLCFFTAVHELRDKQRRAERQEAVPVIKTARPGAARVI